MNHWFVGALRKLTVFIKINQGKTVIFLILSHVDYTILLQLRRLITRHTFVVYLFLTASGKLVGISFLVLFKHRFAKENNAI